ncbi:MAG: NUDIX domain-containing protein [Anaerolineae bacterium]
MIECRSIYGHQVLIARDKLVFRPSVYGIVVDHGRALLVRSRHAGKYTLPGGGVQLGESMTAALFREVREETGVTVSVGRLVHFQEYLYYCDPKDEAYHGLLAYYACLPETFDVLADDQVDDDDAETPGWVEIETLYAADLLGPRGVALALLQAAAAHDAGAL